MTAGRWSQDECDLLKKLVNEYKVTKTQLEDAADTAVVRAPFSLLCCCVCG
jgi:hypothetical protein